MKIKKTCFSTQLSDLYGRDNYQSHIEVGREYWRYFGVFDSDVSETYGCGWYKLRITYIRSGCMFYVFSDYPAMHEQFCPINSFFAATLVCAEIDPIKDLENILDNIETNKLIYCFDEEHTIVHNWPNEREIEIDDDDIYKKISPEDYLLLLIHKI